jgi:hypothetical protein
MFITPSYGLIVLDTALDEVGLGGGRRATDEGIQYLAELLE